jgi:hypothetical protein
MTRRNLKKSPLALGGAALCATLLLGRIGAAADDLTTVGDDKLMNELADRGLDTLLNREFELKGTPASEQAGIRSLHALHQLADPNAKLTNNQRAHLVQMAVQGIQSRLQQITDPDLLFTYYATLRQYGVNEDANILEYWGDDPVIQARLKPAAQTVMALLDRASSAAQAESDELGQHLRGPTDPNADKCQTLANEAQTCIYQKNMCAYFLALATDASTPQGRKDRIKICDDALDYLKAVDSDDSGSAMSIRIDVRLTMGKLNLLKRDFSTAKALFARVISQQPDTNGPNPSPTPSDVYEAKYFTLVADLENHQTDIAQSGLHDLVAWQKSNLPADKQPSLDAAADMLRYRIFNAEVASASSPEEKQKADDNAMAVLDKLKTDHPEFKPIIYDVIMGRISPDAPVARMDPLILQGLMNKGIIERNKPEGATLDTKVMDKAIDAAREVVTRQDRKGISKQLNDDALILIPTLLDREGKSVEAAAGYLDYAEKAAFSNTDQSRQAVDAAGTLIFQLKKRHSPDPNLGPVYDRFLKIAIGPPFNHTELAYAYARRLAAMNQPVEAVKFFRLVAPTDAQYLNAQYFLLLSLHDTLDLKLSSAERLATLSEMATVGERVKKLGQASTEPLDRFKAAHATLIAAEVAGQELKPKDPNRALTLLSDFEQQVKGLPGEKDLLAEAFFVRVNSYMDLGKLEQATASLVALLDKTGGEAGINLVAGLLSQLDKSYDHAEAANDRNEMRDIATNEAKLTGFLADWANKSTDPQIHKYYYQYLVFDARTKRLAGTLVEDPQQRLTDLKAAEAVYQNLRTPEKHALYVQTLDPAKVNSGEIDPTLNDVNVEVGLAFTEFDLKKYSDAQAILGDLLGTHRLGNPTIAVDENNQTTLKDNDVYWQANYEEIASSIEIAKAAGPDGAKIMDGNRQGLKQMLIRGGIPDKWQADFEKLRKDILPDWVVPPVPGAPPTTQQTAVAK